MEVFIRRGSTSGFLTNQMEGVEEMEEQLRGIETFRPLQETEEVTVEITGSWGEIKRLLSEPTFKDVWFKPA
ncbi:hypothetical protein LCGC14_1999360 [marine sediment metagenome]|uniref:Uncharacterized protein n=1 Tax=marine sediment metagenome TaxID=412755 RepID=A0A0F9I0R8_9ZZZZ